MAIFLPHERLPDVPKSKHPWCVATVGGRIIKTFSNELGARAFAEFVGRGGHVVVEEMKGEKALETLKSVVQ